MNDMNERNDFMQAVAYEGYFDNGLFYSAGKTLTIPEKCRVLITILETPQQAKSNRKLQFDFVTDVPPLPDSFFEPLPEDELELWEQ